MACDSSYSKNSAMDAILNQPGMSSLGSLLGNAPERHATQELPEYELKDTSEILDPELNLGRLGYNASDAVPWSQVTLPEKKNLYLELYSRITNYTNADCKVYIDNEEFNCHLIVLQCYSELFDAHIAVKKVELPSDKCSPASFTFIYEWMITGEPSYRDLTRENVLDIFNAAKYLKIKDLVEQCWAFIDNSNVFTEDTAFLLYMDAKTKSLPEVRELMLPRIQTFFLMLVSSQDWLDLDAEDVKNILRSNYICVNCEMEVFMSAVRWLKHDWQERDKVKLEILSCVRFGNIAPWQLVDIKRNPDNPDFMDLAKDALICKMIDDGLAYVIIKYWYGQENEDFQHWNNVLGLQEPPARNWSGTDKTYFTYREFLIYLDQYRRNQMIEKTKPRMSFENRDVVEHKISPRHNHEKVATKIPTIDEFVSKKKTNHRQEPNISPQKRMTMNEAATKIQAFYKGHLVRRLINEMWPDFYQKIPTTNSSIKKSPFTLSARRSSSNNKDVLKLFTPLSSEATAQTKKMRSNILELPKKEYITKTSLFLPDRESVVVFGGIDPHGPYGVKRNSGQDIIRYLPDYNIWEYVGDMPEPRHHHSVVFLKSKVYLAGGGDPRDEDVKGKSTVVNSVWSLEPITRTWCEETSLNTARKNFGMIVADQCIYVIGGQDSLGRSLESVEKYDPTIGEWTDKAPLNHPRAGIACTKYKHHIWTAGGLTGSKNHPLSDIVESYDIKTDQWTDITRLHFPRCFASMFVMSERLYLIGGAINFNEKDKMATSVGTIDEWDVQNREWKKLSEMAIPRHGHAVAYLGTQILIMGGVTTTYMRALSNAECFCSQRGTWVRGIACLPTPLYGHAAATLPPAMLMTS